MTAPETVHDAGILIVLAWTTTRSRSPWPGVVETIEDAHACVWLRAGRVSDIDRARSHLATLEHTRGQVYTFPHAEPEPLARARARVLQEPPG